MARAISILLHPFVTSLVLVAATAHGGSAARPITAVIAIAIIPVAVLMFRQVRGGRWTNVDASNRWERPLLFGVAGAGLAALLVWLLLTEPSSPMVRGVTATAAMIAVAAILTRWIKVSLHMTFAAFAAVTLTLMGSVVGYVLLALLPLLAWSRLSLSRHTGYELVAGFLLGAITGAMLVLL